MECLVLPAGCCPLHVQRGFHSGCSPGSARDCSADPFVAGGAIDKLKRSSEFLQKWKVSMATMLLHRTY